MPDMIQVVYATGEREDVTLDRFSRRLSELCALLRPFGARVAVMIALDAMRVVSGRIDHAGTIKLGLNPPGRAPARKVRRKPKKRGSVDLVALRRDLRRPGFNAPTWAREHGVHDSAVYRAVERIAKPKLYRKKKSAPTADRRAALLKEYKRLGSSFSPVAYARKIGAPPPSIHTLMTDMRRKGELPAIKRANAVRPRKKKGGAEAPPPKPTADLSVPS